MRKLLFMTALLASANTTAHAATPTAPDFTPVFTAGENGYPAVRIPSIIVTKAGVLLAFAEGRKNLGDQAENKIILRRSLDGGKTWTPTQTIADDGKRPLNNPCAVVEEKTGRVLLMFQSYPEKLKEASGQIKTGYEGDDIVKSYLLHSDDDGQSWSALQEITKQVKRAAKATTIASGPGIGIQLKQGAHAGRLIMPFNQGPFGKWNAYAVYSDDSGATWQCGADVPNGAGVVNECQIVELSDGRVMLNSRQMGGKALRKMSVSEDGGQTWSPLADAPDLVDPRCQGSILHLRDGNLLYSGPRSTKRENGTVYLSRDDGQTWPIYKTLVAGNFAYSNLVELPDGTIGCLFETDNHQHITFARFSLEWLNTP